MFTKMLRLSGNHSEKNSLPLVTLQLTCLLLLLLRLRLRLQLRTFSVKVNTTTLVMPKLLAMRDVIAHFPVLVAGVLGAVRNPVLQIFQKYQLDKAQLINNVMSLIHTESGNGSPEVREARLSGWINQVDTSSAKLRNAILVTVTFFHQL